MSSLTKDTFLKRVDTAWKSWQDVLAATPEHRFDEPGACGTWSLKDVMAHIAWYENEMVQMLQSRRFAGSEYWAFSQPERNRRIHHDFRDHSQEEILQLARKTHADLIRLLEQTTDWELTHPQAFPGMPPDWQPADVIAGNTYEHYQFHVQHACNWLNLRGMTS